MKSNFAKGISYIPKLYYDKERKPIFKILREIFFLTIKDKTIPTHYISRHLYKKGINNIGDYIPNKVLLSIHPLLNDVNASQVLNNKLFFYLHFSKFFRNLANILMYNHNDAFVIDKNYFRINSVQEFESIVFDLVSNKSATKSIFIKKTYDSHGGANTYRIDHHDFPLQRVFIEELFSEVKKTAYLFQETIIQHDELNRLNPSCINTIRMDTFYNKDGNVEIIGPYLRMSISNLHVDNTSSGGCFVGINLDSGKLKKIGYTSISKTGGKVLLEHPLTKVLFQDFEIPYFAEAKQFIIKVASLIPSLRLVGWDVAITPSGPVLIEGNYNYDITNNDLVYGGYRNNPVFRKVLQELNINS